MFSIFPKESNVETSFSTANFHSWATSQFTSCLQSSSFAIFSFHPNVSLQTRFSPKACNERHQNLFTWVSSKWASEAEWNLELVSDSPHCNRVLVCTMTFCFFHRCRCVLINFIFCIGKLTWKRTRTLQLVMEEAIINPFSTR